MDPNEALFRFIEEIDALARSNGADDEARQMAIYHGADLIEWLQNEGLAPTNTRRAKRGYCVDPD